ncbi:HEPN domain-containing protein [Duganella sp. HH105]|uniref:HEPN domain-containing protein n=1 Tax=Duganella sp. HH105 TaxID=1781067 RepID=UPI0008931C17|nr:HEPN domain-containing protein [Duganella sp. HH105]OEZ61779.1 hypothetical protein DUGA6_22300 [Duganella sp. HH105]
MDNFDFDVRVNDFAIRAFRNSADKDYIAARLCIKAGLVPQFLWSSLQAFEKYLKCILLLNRIPSGRLGHKIEEALKLVRREVPYTSDLRPDDLGVFSQIASQGADRYLINSYAVHGHVLPELDAAIWDVRRYCQTLRPLDGCTSQEARIYELTLEQIIGSRSSPSSFKISGGLLEKIVADRHHSAHSGLCWQNIFFCKNSRSKIKARFYLEAENAPLLLYPEMVDYLSDLIFIPGKSFDEYKEFLQQIDAGIVERF